MRGDGVVGEQPHLHPGQGFRYSSGTVIETPVGAMEGAYSMKADDGQQFDAPIAPFRLAMPRRIAVRRQVARYAIGDVQGCFDELRALIERIGFSADRDQLWFVGDLVNRGPKSLEVLRYVRWLGDDGGHGSRQSRSAPARPGVRHPSQEQIERHAR